MNLVSWCAIGFLTPGAVLATISRQKLIEIEFKQFRNEWLADGKPVGGAESRRASSFWRSDQATREVSEKWLLSTPSWVLQSPQAVNALRTFRLGVILLVAGVLATIGVAAWSS